ncbi:MAG: GNAT family N-acetyltransferase [Spirochaetia bacterium]|jgi:GNAT superfamily N-acetyltransferase|nr:GNAT family N-acetyltransferase [Spirochaetia bacterium]
MKWTRDNFCLYDERGKANAEVIHIMLADTYWAKDRSLQTVLDTIERCLCFSLYDQNSQIGFTRVLTDYATYAILLDVVIQERYRGQGLGKWMMECITAHSDLAHLKQVLWTSGAEGLYHKCGFTVPENVHFMVKKIQSE